MVRRAPSWNGMGQYELKPPLGFAAIGCELTCANSPQPLQKKSPYGTSIAGSSAPSQKARNSSVRQLSLCVVSQMWVIFPAPWIDARSKVSPASMSTLGEIFQPGPRSRALATPVPSVARPPPPREPSKFSRLIDRVSTARRREIELRSAFVTGAPVRRREDVGGDYGAIDFITVESR